MLALYRSGRQAEASTVFHRLRRTLDESEGLEPSPAVQQLLTRILKQDPSLELDTTPVQQPARAHNLPVQLTSFIGREQEVHQLEQYLVRSRLISLVGPPGVGKTRLALQAASSLVGKHVDGVWLVELAPLRDPDLVPQVVAAVVTSREQPGRLLLDNLVAELRDRDVLLVLDNCEHLLDAVATVVDALVRQCPGSSVLVTSRERLGMAGELIVEVSPLRVPDLAGAVSPISLHNFDAVHLFTDRAALVQPKFSLTPQNALAVAQICRRLEGIPLALELAAAHMNAISADAMVARLSDRFQVLGPARGVAAHHRTLRATLDWSYALLADEEKVLFRRLSVFVGAFEVEAAEAVCGCAPLVSEDILVLLSKLVDKSLVAAEQGSGTPTYRLLETMREYALHHLAESGKLDDLRGRHCRYLVSLADSGRPLLRSLESAGWLIRMVQEEGNLRAALEWSAQTHASREALSLGLQLATTLGPFWESRGLWNEGRQWLDLFLSRLPEVTAVRGQALFWAGWLAFRSSNSGAVYERTREALAVAERLRDVELLGLIHFLAGYMEFLRGNGSLAEDHLEQSERLFTSLDEPRALAVVLATRSGSHLDGGDVTTAYALANRALAQARAANMEIGSSADTQMNRVLLRRGDLEAARTRWQDGLRRPHQEAVYTRVAMMGLAAVAAAQGQARRALRLEAASMALKRKWELHTGPAGSPLDSTFARFLNPARQALDDDARAEAAAEGFRMTDEQAIEYALSDRE
jgi:non-specific serine/threonine protein kinase